MRRLDKKNKYHIGEYMERFMAVIVCIAIIIAIVALTDKFIVFWNTRNESGAFLEFIGSVFSIVIGIEFFKLLWHPSKDTLLDVLMFVIARHMIIDHTTTMENLLSIISITILFFVDRFLLHGDNEFKIFNKESGTKEEKKSE